MRLVLYKVMPPRCLKHSPRPAPQSEAPLQRDRRPKPPRPGAEPSYAALREQARVYGMRALSDSELVTLLLGERSRGLSPLKARLLIEDAGGLLGLARSSLSRLLESLALTNAQVTRLAAALELGQRAHRDSLLPHPQQPLTHESVAAWARPRLAGLEHEEVWVLTVNAQASLRSIFQVGRGGMHGCGLLARDILQPVIRDGASGFVLVHNHPSGDPEPSPEDVHLTRGLQFAATSVSVPLLDHVIVGKEGARSFFQLGLLDTEAGMQVPTAPGRRQAV